MALISFGANLTLNQFADAVVSVGQSITIIGEGEPGIGKSSVLKMVAKRLPEYQTAYIDCTLLDLGDFALPYVVEINDMKVTQFAPNARFKFHLGAPVVIMLDEIGKASKSVKNVLLTLLLERRIGDHYLPEGSIVFATTNLASDGVGDYLEGHARNRVCVVEIGKPGNGFTTSGALGADGWAPWAVENDVDPLVLAFARQYPQVFASYKDGDTQKDNPYIWNPLRAGGGACVTPRSLAFSSPIVKQRAALGEATTLTLLAGTIGESAARDMQAFFTLVDKLPTWEQITTQPDTAKVPDDPAARCLLVISAMQRMDAQTLTPWLTYLRRLDKEWQALFVTSTMRSTSKLPIVTRNRAFVDLARTNQWMV
jgi:hypothetical protein